MNCSAGVLRSLHKEGKLRMVKGVSGRIDWDSTDIFRLAGLETKSQINVIYARTEPLGPSQASAEDRLEQQKARLIRYCQNYGVQVDLVIGEIRRVNRVRAVDGKPAGGFSALMGLIAERKIRNLVIESRDRLNVGGSWEMFEWIMKSICGINVVVANQHVVTTESREESKFWIADMLQIHKIMVGEIKDKTIIQNFIGGPDAKLAKAAVRKVDETMRQKKRIERATGQERKIKKQHVDLDELFD